MDRRPRAEPARRDPSWAALVLLSAATLLYEIHLTRLYSVSQFYHFAFMVISLAMLGFGASGAALALAPRLTRGPVDTRLGGLSAGFAVTAVGAYALVNVVPFDSYALAIERRQIVILAGHYVALSAPFFCSGAAVGLLFRRAEARAGAVYGANLGGSALGCALALLAPTAVGGEGTVLLAGAAGMAAGALFLRRRVPAALYAALAVAALAAATRPPAALEPRLSPYKGLSYALQYPGARVVARRWNSFSRVDLVESAGIRSLPGLSYRYTGPLPAQRGLYVDGDDLSPVLDPGVDDAFSAYLPSALAYALAPDADALVLEPRGGLEVWVALGQGARRVTAVEPNPLIVSLVGAPYDDPRVRTVVEDPRSAVRREGEAYDVIVLSLTSSYRTVRSGAYSLGEDYRLTVEAMGEYLARLRPGGYLVLHRWLQTPPSESLRAYALAVEALEAAGQDPAARIVALRGYAMMTLLVKPEPFSPQELAAVRRFAGERALDLVAAPELAAEETNRYNLLPEPTYYLAFRDLLDAEDRDGWYDAYPYDVRPPTDDHPFFGHYFRWAQTPQLVAELGSTWEPFGGAGYVALLVLAGVAALAAGTLILLPVAVGRLMAIGMRGVPPQDGAGQEAPRAYRIAGYFGLLGLGYLLVEVPLIQRFIVFLGQPAYALTLVLLAVLLFSGLGGLLSWRLQPRWALALLVACVVAYPFGLPALFGAALGLGLGARAALTVVALAPLGILMGMPFPLGMDDLRRRAPDRVAWAWGVNGATSVVASVLATLLALGTTFRWVLLAGALCYAGAWVVAPGGSRAPQGEGSEGAVAPSTPAPVKGTKMTPPRFSARRPSASRTKRQSV